MTGRPGLPFDPPSPPARPGHRVYLVSELTADLRVLLESTYPEIWVEGEISNARVWKTGHLYFTLKDRTAQLKAVMFRSALRYLRFKPVDGQQVVARGRVSLYEPKGEYQIVCEHLEPQGVGALQLAFDQLRRRLQDEGLFDEARKRPLPALPGTVGVVTSLDGAAIRDVLSVLGRRHPDVGVLISPVRVQGPGAAGEIVRGITQLGHRPDVDVIVVARGGGSIEDLWAFNEEPVARAIASAPVPVISAVGHETDFTISDFVADLRAPTPSAAAELVVARKEELIARISRTTERLVSALHDGLALRRATVHRLEARPGLAGWPARLAVRGRHAGELIHRLTRAARTGLADRERQMHDWQLRLEALDLGRRLGRIRRRLESGQQTLIGTMREQAQARRGRLGSAVGRLEALSPLAVLARGYAVCWAADRTTIVRDARDVVAGARVRVTLHRGALDCEVKGTD